jgi:hypothetical protein
MSISVQGTVGCTIAARNYLPYVRVLADGWHRHHDLPLFALLIDALPGEVEVDGIDVVTPEDLAIDPDELQRMRGIYGIAEMTTALKPHLLRHLLGRGSEAIVYLDADSDVHASLAGVVDLARRHGTVLSPHLLEPVPADGLSPSESEIAWGGYYNSGFIAVTAAAEPFLAWWAKRLRRDCLFCEPMSMHADQRWLDLVPSYFEHAVLRDPGVNVAQWNLHERPITFAGGAFRAKGRPLRTFHFSAYDPRRPAVLASGEWPHPLRLHPGADAALDGLCREYGRRLLCAGWTDARAIPYRYAASASGTPLTAHRRRAYRELVIAAEAQGTDLPDPFDPSRASEFEALIADAARSDLLSPAARQRIHDARIAGPGDERGSAAESLLRQALQLARRLPIRGPVWQPYPLPSDRTLLEYPTPVGVGDIELVMDGA